jgi:hypothetical protein
MALFAEKVLLVTVSVALGLLKMPPPYSALLAELKVPLVTVSVPLL